MKNTKWVRTCQECGNEVEDTEPDNTKKLSMSYSVRACTKCGSPALDYGTTRYIPTGIFRECICCNRSVDTSEFYEDSIKCEECCTVCDDGCVYKI